jgi:hypothetical protein
MATLTKGQSFGVTEQVTNTKLHNLVDDATITDIVNADCSASMALDNSKIAELERANWVSGSSFYNLGSLPTTAGTFPVANLPTSYDSFSLKNLGVTSIASIAELNVNTELNIAGAGGITAIKDEDDMDSDSDTSLATQQSIKAYVDNNKEEPLSNIIFSWSAEDSTSTYAKEDDVSYVTYLNFKFKKISGISTITIYARLFNNLGGTAYTAFCKVDIGGENNEVSSDNNTPAWATAADIDVSGLTNGQVYDGIVQLKNEENTSTGVTYLSAITLIAS